mmetsp:Transcript_92/g.145  ORF Transcript_92/g.145 Transcript_92/m.145 type:complete len:110 (+) Transcript_92:47-376(+)
MSDSVEAAYVHFRICQRAEEEKCKVRTWLREVRGGLPTEVGSTTLQDFVAACSMGSESSGATVARRCAKAGDGALMVLPTAEFRSRSAQEREEDMRDLAAYVESLQSAV